MPKMYKLVTQDFTTHGNTKWILGVTVTAKGMGKEMCSDAVLHCYNNKYLAVIFNPLHANISNPHLIEIDCSPIITTDGLKYACKSQTMIKEIKLPAITTLQKVEFAIRCAMLVHTEKEFTTWANNWLSGKDRTGSAAGSAAESAARSAAESAAWSAAWSAAESAMAAAGSARSAAESAAGESFSQIIDKIMEN